MKIPTFLIFLFVFILFGCTKADPNAYRGDPILQDYQAQLQVTNGQLESINKQIESTNKDIKTSVPQSGQLVQLQKKLYDLRAQADRLTQQIKFWKIRIESRAKEAQLEYLNAYKNKQEWPNKETVSAYYAEKRLRQAKMQWDQKERISDYKKSSQPASGGGTHGAPEGGHGGGHE